MSRLKIELQDTNLPTQGKMPPHLLGTVKVSSYQAFQFPTWRSLLGSFHDPPRIGINAGSLVHTLVAICRVCHLVEGLRRPPASSLSF